MEVNSLIFISKYPKKIFTYKLHIWRAVYLPSGKIKLKD